jgi:hypothetical protein
LEVVVPRLLALPLALAAVAVATTATVASAATYTVTTTADSGAGSLRAAVGSANADPTAEDDILLASATYTLGSPLVVSSPIRIFGNGSGATTVSGGNATRVFDVAAVGALQLNDLAVVDGNGGGPGAGVRLPVDTGPKAGRLVLTRTRFAGHRGGTAVYGRGGSTVTATDALFEGNGGVPATSVEGGAIFLVDTSGATITRGTFRDNHVTGNGGAISVWNDATATITDSTFSANTSDNDGGAINVWNGSEVTIAGTTISGNTSHGDGGGINQWNESDLFITTTTLAGNTADGNGGAVNQWNQTFLDISRSTVSGNHAGDKGGAFFAWNNVETGMSNTTVHGNTATTSGGAFQHGNVTTIDMVNSTISGNSAGMGGLLYNDTTPAAGQTFFRFQNSVFAGNTATSGPGGCAHSSPAIAFSVGSQGHNVDDGNTCALTAAGDRPSTDAQLGPLQNNGGPTQTRALGAGSAARNLIPPGSRRRSFAACPTVDQRGFPRPQEGACDAGAFEFPTPPPTAPAETPAATTPPPLAVLPRPVAIRLAALKAKDVLSLPSSRRCVSRRAFRIRLRTPKGARITGVVVKVNTKRVKTVRGRRITAPVNLRGLPKGRFTVSIQITLADGRKVTGTRRYRTCTPKRRGRRS